MSANTLWRWLLGRAEPARVAWATGAQPAAGPPGRAAASPVSTAAAEEAGEKKEWEPGVWARAAIGIYS